MKRKDQAELEKAILTKYSYNKSTGEFTTISTGVVATKSSASYGYVSLGVKLKGKRKGVSAHRMVNLIHHGEWPDVIDHINGVRDDNRIENLRGCTAADNARNRRVTSTSKSGYRGVTKKRGKWQASIKVDNEDCYLGVYNTSLDAAKAYDCAAIKMHGEFATLNGVDIKDFKRHGIRKNECDHSDALVTEVVKAFYMCKESGRLMRRGARRGVVDNKNGIARIPGGRGVSIERIKHAVIHGVFPPRKRRRHRHYDMSNIEDRFDFQCSFMAAIDYNKDTGEFTRGGVALGSERNGYLTISHENKTVLAHRMAYLITYAEWPEVVDHINHDGRDNRIKNLRGATKATNAANHKPRTGGASKYKGVARSKGDRWRADCGGVYIGSFASEESAARAYDKRAVELNGEFAYINFQDKLNA